MKKGEKPEAPSFEGALARLESIVAELEKGELALEQSLALYEEGVKLSRLCHAKLEEAEARIEVLVKDAKGEPVPGEHGQPATRPLAAEGGEDDVPF
jgi:exodeoxyribonuclease VII small subunit